MFVALIRSVAGHEQAGHVLRDFFQKFFTALISSMGADRRSRCA